MSFDWYIKSNEQIRSLIKAIASLNKQIATKMNEIKDAAQDKKAQLKKEKKDLENTAENKWNEAYKLTPYFSACWKSLSSCYLAEDQPLADLVRDRYTKLQSGEERVRIKQDIESQKLLDVFNFFKIPAVDISLLLPFSFFLQFTFTLAKPYLSKDDEGFYICENPVKKDKVFKVPTVPGSTWKGNMRWTAGRLLEMDGNVSERFKKRIQISNLFGNENEAEKRYFDALMPEKKEAFEQVTRTLFNKEGLRKGRLNFYPTFFDQISLEVINPHDRKTKAGTVPIYIESVPAGASGTFSLLYVPFDLMGKSSEEVKQQVSEDINLVYNSLKEMMLTYGFSAKKSCGFGVIEEDINGIFEMSGNKDKKPTNPEPGQPTQTKKKKTYSTFSELLDSTQPTKQPNSLTFSSFEKLKDIINQVKAEVMKNAG